MCLRDVNRGSGGDKGNIEYAFLEDGFTWMVALEMKPMVVKGEGREIRCWMERKRVTKSWNEKRRKEIV